jgi:hypothetical protein
MPKIPGGNTVTVRPLAAPALMSFWIAVELSTGLAATYDVKHAGELVGQTGSELRSSTRRLVETPLLQPNAASTNTLDHRCIFMTASAT